MRTEGRKLGSAPGKRAAAPGRAPASINEEAPRFNAGWPDSYPTFIIGYVIQARIPMRRCSGRGVMTQQRKQSHDDEKFCPHHIDDDADRDRRTCIRAGGRIVHPGSQRPGARTSKCDTPSMLPMRRWRRKPSITTNTVIVMDRNRTIDVVVVFATLAN